jgi:hypothetical protein
MISMNQQQSSPRWVRGQVCDVLRSGEHSPVPGKTSPQPQIPPKGTQITELQREIFTPGGGFWQPGSSWALLSGRASNSMRFKTIWTASPMSYHLEKDCSFRIFIYL